MVNGNDLVEHIEKCCCCQRLEDLREKLIKIKCKDCFQAITDMQINCFNEENG